MADQAKGLLSPWLRKKRIEMVYPFLKGKVLDVGCGIGFLSQFIDPEHYLGIDIDEESLGIAHLKNPSKRFQKEYPSDELFDTIILLAVLEHVEDPVQFLNSLKMLLKPGGRIILTTPHPSMIKWHHWGAKVGIFSKEAGEEHKDIFDDQKIKSILTQAKLVVIHKRRFLFGANQFFVVGSP